MAFALAFAGTPASLAAFALAFAGAPASLAAFALAFAGTPASLAAFALAFAGTPASLAANARTFAGVPQERFSPFWRSQDCCKHFQRHFGRYNMLSETLSMNKGITFFCRTHVGLQHVARKKQAGIPDLGVLLRRNRPEFPITAYSSRRNGAEFRIEARFRVEMCAR